jgi:hypothetical protein
LKRLWHEIVDEPVKKAGGRPDVSYAVFNPNIIELRKEHDDATIEAGFVRFAAMVDSGKIDVRNRDAWFSFWSRRAKLVRSVAPKPPPAKSVRRSSLDIPRSPKRSSLER